MTTKDFVSLLYYLTENPKAFLKTDTVSDSWMEIRLGPNSFLSYALKKDPQTGRNQILSTSPLVLKDHIWKKNEWKVEET